MKNLFLSIFFLSMIFKSVMGQNTPVENGYTAFYYPNGKISSEGTMKNGKPEGIWKSYYPSGILKSIGRRTNHLLDSVWVFFDEKGDTTQKVNYVMGKRNGFTITYYNLIGNEPVHKNLIQSTELFINDKKEGLSKDFYENGKIKEEAAYKNNSKNGLAKEYNEDGLIITLNTYKNGVLIDRQKINRKDSNGLKQGIWIEYFADGKAKKETNYRDDILEGSYKEYDENGGIKLHLEYKNGLLTESKDTLAFEITPKEVYDSLGNIIFSGYYKNDIPVGIHRKFDHQGNVINAYIYNNSGIKIGEGIITREGKKEGPWKNYFQNGTISSIGNYKNNLRTGSWKFYYDEGKIEQEGKYKNDKEDGLWKWYYLAGSIKTEDEFNEGKEEGLFTEYDTLGNVITNGSYFDGQKEGEWTYKVGDYSEKGKYVGDLKDGKWQAFYKDGKLFYEGLYIQGTPDGEHDFYYPNGKLKEVEYFTSGIAEKTWKKYDENGQLTIAITYKDNHEYRINGEKVDFAVDDIKLIK
jgi:uncharacterized protein